MLVTVLGMVVFLHPDISVFDDVSMIALQLFRESNLGFNESTVIEVRLVQPAKTSSSMVVTLLGMVIEVRQVQCMKAPPHMLVTLLGMVTEVRLVQPAKV